MNVSIFLLKITSGGGAKKYKKKFSHARYAIIPPEALCGARNVPNLFSTGHKPSPVLTLPCHESMTPLS